MRRQYDTPEPGPARPGEDALLRVSAGRPDVDLKHLVLRMAESSMTSANTVKREQNHAHDHAYENRAGCRCRCLVNLFILPTVAILTLGIPSGGVACSPHTIHVHDGAVRPCVCAEGCVRTLHVVHR